MFAYNMDDARALFQAYLDHFGIPYEVDEDGDFTWDFEIMVDQLDSPLPGFGMAVFTNMNSLDAGRLEVSQAVMSRLPDESVSEVARLVALVNQDAPMGIAFVIYDGDPCHLAVTSGVVSEVFSKKMLQFQHMIPLEQLKKLQPALLAVLSGQTAAEAKMRFWD